MTLFKPVVFKYLFNIYLDERPSSLNKQMGSLAGGKAPGQVALPSPSPSPLPSLQRITSGKNPHHLSAEQKLTTTVAHLQTRLAPEQTQQRPNPDSRCFQMPHSFLAPPIPKRFPLDWTTPSPPAAALDPSLAQSASFQVHWEACMPGCSCGGRLPCSHESLRSSTAPLLGHCCLLLSGSPWLRPGFLQ